MSAQRIVGGVIAAWLLIFSQLAVAQSSNAAQGPAVEPDVAAAQQRIDNRADAILDKLFAKHPDVKDLYAKAAGYAVFTVTRAGFIVSGAGGEGVAVNKQTGERTYMKMGSAGVGLSFGATRIGLVILFKTPERFANFVEGGWNSSATAGATAGTEGVDVGSSFFNGVAIYRMTKRGLMASANVSGARFWVADDLN